MATPTNDLRVRRIDHDDDFRRALELRFAVFVHEQGVPAELEHDEADATATHVIAELGETLVGTGRLVVEDGAPRIGRVAVLPAYRHQGIATRLLQALEQEAAAQGFREVALHAQTYARALYDKNGYTVTGDPFVEAGIDHITMTKAL